MAKLLGEKFVQDRIVEHLFRKGWSQNLRAKGLREHGVDIKVRNNKYSRYWLIEVKGDASKTAKSPLSRREVNFNAVLGQIVTRMHTEGARGYKYRYRYGIGLPDSFRDRVMRRLPYDVADKLNLFVFFVNHDGKVDVCDWRKLKKAQGAL